LDFIASGLDLVASDFDFVGCSLDSLRRLAVAYPAASRIAP